MQYVTAIRDGVKRRFSLGIWQAMNGNKYGWKLAADEPEELARLKVKQEAPKLPEGTTPEDYAQKLAMARAKVADADKKYAAALEKGVAPNINRALATKTKADEELQQLLHAQAD